MTGAVFKPLAGRLSFTVCEARWITIRWHSREITETGLFQRRDKRHGFQLFPSAQQKCKPSCATNLRMIKIWQLPWLRRATLLMP